MSDSLKKSERFPLSRSFLVSDLTDSLTQFLCQKVSNLLKKVSDLLRSLIFGERLERIPHSSSFLVSDLSETLTVAQFW